ncbi:ABC transporter permease [Bordetella sp. 2513F-2]
MSGDTMPLNPANFAGSPRRARRRLRFGPFETASVLLLGLTAAMIFYPLGTIFWRAFFVEGGTGLAQVLDTVATPAMLGVFGNTFLVAGASSLLALLIGASFAWLIERTDARTGLASEFLPLVPLLVPQISGVIGWVILLSPQAGMANAVLRWIAGWFGVSFDSGPINLFTYTGLICVMTLYLVPYVYLTVSAALQNLNPSLEEASRICGASPWRTLRRVTLPAVWPAIVNAGIIVLIFAISLFSVPIVIGTSAGIDVLSVTIYRLLYNHPPQTDLAVMLSLAMMVIVQLALLAQLVVTRASRHAVISGKGTAPTRIALGPWRWLARSAINAHLLATAIIPVAALLVVSLQPFWTTNVDWSMLDLANYRYVLHENEMTSRALMNSIGLGVVGATLGMVGAAVLVLFSRSAGPRAQMLIDGTTAFPATLPHTVVAVSMVLAFTGGVLNLHGTFLILLLANLVLVVPQAVRSAHSALAQVGSELIEAAHMARSGSFKTFRRIILPLMLPGLMAGWVILFVHISGELTASALLSGTNNPVVGLVLLDLWENGSFPQLSAIALIMTLLDAVVVMTMLYLARRKLRLFG